MRSFWLFCCLFALTLTTTHCAEGPQYWTYHQGIPPAHLVHPVYIPVWVDQGFTPAQVVQIELAVQEWNQVFNRQIVMTLQTHQELGTDHKTHTYPTTFNGWEAGQKLVSYSEQSNLGIVFFDLKVGNPHLQGGEGVLAYVEGPGQHAVYVVCDRLGSRSLKDIMMHELAHLFGALHVNAPSLETPFYSPQQYDCIDKITVAQVAAYQHLDFDTLSYCRTPHFE